MKKLLSLVLATAMVLTMSAVSFAFTDFTGTVAAAKDSLDNAIPVAQVSDDYYLFDSTEGMMDGEPSPDVAYGDTIYYALMDASGDLIGSYDAVKSMSVKTDWEMGSSLVGGAYIVKKRFATATYAYFLAIDFKEKTTASSVDVIGEVTIKKSSGDYKIVSLSDGENYIDVDVSVEVGFPKALDEFGSVSTIYDDPYIYEFDDEDDEEFEFDFDAMPDAYFTVNITGQGDLVLQMDTDFNSDVAAEYPAANLDFFNGNGASFNRTGELFIPAEDGSYLYRLNSDGTLSNANAEYDGYEEGFLIKTRTLGTYVISDEELDLTATVTDVTDDGGSGTVVVTEPALPANPVTGAAA